MHTYVALSTVPHQLIQQLSQSYGLVVPTLKMRELRHRLVKELVQGHRTKRKRWTRLQSQASSFQSPRWLPPPLLILSDPPISSTAEPTKTRVLLVEDLETLIAPSIIGN